MNSQSAINPKQGEFLQAKWGRINILQGSVRSGKTHCLNFLAPYLSTRAGKGAIVAKTLETLRENILDPMIETVGAGISYSDSGRRIIIGGVPVRGVGANDESSKNKIQGSTLSWALGDELTLWPESFFKMLLSRLSTSGAQFFGSCNPDSPYHWLKTDFIDRENDLDLKNFHFVLADNPTLPPDYVKNLKKEYTGVWALRYIKGLWVLAEGVIYDMFKKENHIVNIPKNKKFSHYFCASDYGINNPCVFGLFGYNTKDKVFLLKEYYYDSNKSGKQKTDSEYTIDFLDFIKGYSIKWAYVDPSALSFIVELRKKGINVLSAKNEVLEGVKFVSKQLSNNHLFIDKTCTETIKEFSTYSWDKNAQKRGEDKPIKANDHSMDMIRYGLYSQWGGVQYVPRKQTEVY